MEKDLELKRFMQLGIVVRNLESAVANWEARGVGPWVIDQMDNSKPPFDDMLIDGKEAEKKGVFIKTAMTTAYGFEIELIEPVGDSQFKTWLEEHGPGIHHVAFDTKSDYHKLLADTKEKTGKDPWIRGQGFGGKMDFSYLDLREELGILLECYVELTPGKYALPYDAKADIV